MKKQPFFLLFLLTPWLYYAQVTKDDALKIEAKNEIRISSVINTGGPHFAIDYERAIKPNIGLGFFAKKNSLKIELNDDFELEEFGFGIKSRFYLNDYHTPAFLNGYYTKRTFVRVFAEAFAEFVKGEKYETQRKLNDENIYIISRDYKKFNSSSINIGIGSKYAFYEKVTLQINAGVSKYFPKNGYLNFGGYFTVSAGVLF